MSDRPLRKVLNADGKVIRLMDLMPGDRFHMSEEDGQDLGWWTAEDAPFIGDDGRTVIMARPDIEPESMRE